MGVFKDGDEVGHYLGGIFETGFKNPDLAAKFKAVDTVIRIEYSNPDCVTTVDFTNGVVEYGPGSTLKPEIRMWMEADVAHRFWLGKENVGIAIAKGRMKVKGSVPKVMKIVPITKPLYATYNAMLNEEGRTDLLAID
ncbi:MAG: SCP2 sterol-binding domain-containing protein [Acidimicrobiia bacterium]